MVIGVHTLVPTHNVFHRMLQLSVVIFAILGEVVVWVVMGTAVHSSGDNISFAAHFGGIIAGQLGPRSKLDK